MPSTAVFANIMKSENRHPEKCKIQRPFNNCVVYWPIKLKLGRDIIQVKTHLRNIETWLPWHPLLYFPTF